MKNNRLLIASENPGKVIEIQAVLVGLGIELYTPKELGFTLSVVEDGKTYEENASKKAIAHALQSGLVALADDSGLEVDALNGEPGIFSARYAQVSNPTDLIRRTYLLSKLEGMSRPWKAHFHATVAIAVPGGNVEFAEGNCYGEIIPEERGKNGFGYDPIFLLSSMGKTMAELTLDEKNRVSHRALALENARPILIRIFHLADYSITPGL